MASAPLLSAGERGYIIGGVEEDVRIDGRGCMHVGNFNLRTGVVSNTNGSAKIEREHTSAIIGVKAELGEPHPYTPNKGRLEFHVDCSALAGPIYERRGGEVLSRHLCNGLECSYTSASCVDLASLSIIPGEQCWILYVDTLILEAGGSVLDTLSIGVRAALQTTSIPKLTVTGEGEEMEIEVSDNPHDYIPVDAGGAPVIITFNKIGGQYVVDCTSKEEFCTSCQLSLAIDKDDNILATTMEGSGGIPYLKINDIIKKALDVAGEVIQSMDVAQQTTTTSSTLLFN